MGARARAAMASAGFSFVASEFMFDPTGCTKEQAIRRFLKCLRDQSEVDRSTIAALNRLDCWAEAVTPVLGWRSDQKHAKALLSLWMVYGLWSVPRGLKDRLPLILDTLKRHLPTYRGDPPVLYRGQSLERFRNGVIGIAWTPNIEKAVVFAKYRETDGVVLHLNATSEMIVTAMRNWSARTLILEEDEHLVDPRLAAGRISVVRTVAHY